MRSTRTFSARSSTSICPFLRPSVHPSTQPPQMCLNLAQFLFTSSSGLNVCVYPPAPPTFVSLLRVSTGFVCQDPLSRHPRSDRLTLDPGLKNAVAQRCQVWGPTLPQPPTPCSPPHPAHQNPLKPSSSAWKIYRNAKQADNAILGDL